MMSLFGREIKKVDLFFVVYLAKFAFELRLDYLCKKR